MFQKLLLAVGLFLSADIAHSQTMATDFTAIDCSGDSHNLFTELNSGKTVILAWVMPCVGCIVGTKRADSSFNSLIQTYPDSILLWIVDDGPPSDCNTLFTWTWNQQITNGSVFGNYSNEINQDDYGGFGMPHIVVIGANKQIYFNEFNGSADGIYSALQNAIQLATEVKKVNGKLRLEVYPNPIQEEIIIRSSELISDIKITSITGQILKVEHYNNGSLNPTIHMEGIAAGSYILSVIDVNGNSEIKKIIKNQN